MAQVSETYDDQDEFAETTTNAEPESHRKLFVGGLSWQTSEDSLQQYFEELNMTVERVLIMRDKVTGRSRGFGFVTLSESFQVDKAVTTNLHLDGRKIEAKRAIPKREMDKNSKKLFVGGIPISLSNTEFRKYFEAFGTVVECQVMTERESGRSRGFGFVTFEDEEVTERVLRARHEILGKTVEVKRAEPKKLDRSGSRPITIMHPMSMPGMYFSHPGYPYHTAPITYSSPPIYGQHLAYDPGYFLAQGAVFAPHQLIPIDDPAFDGRTVLAPMLAHLAPSPMPHSTSPSSSPPTSRTSWTAHLPHYEVVAGSSTSRATRSPLGGEVRSERAWSASLVPVDLTTMSLSDSKLRASAEQRKKRGMSQPQQRNRQSFNSSFGANRHTGSYWRHSNNITTNSDDNNVKQATTAGDSSCLLHKYFQ